MDFKKVLSQTEKYKPQITQFLRDIVAISSESSDEKRVIQRIKQEMEKVGFDRIEIDEMGNILGYIGEGEHLIAMDAHIDTVGMGEKKLWDFDPLKGYEDEETIGGRGTSDQKGGMASLVYAAKIIKDLELLDDYTLLITGTVQEEDCDGLCWQYLIKEKNIKPEFVISTEPTSCNIYRGQRGRMEIKVTTSGLSCHGSAPERGENAIYKMGDIISDLEKLNENLIYDKFLGKGTLVVSEISSNSPSRCAVPDKCSISIDRRLTAGESHQYALEQIRNLPSVKKWDAEVKMFSYDKPSYKDFSYPTECYFPSWTIPEDHLVTRSLKESYEKLFQEEPLIDKWTFSTNGVSIMGRHNIPCIGFGPGHEDQAHAPNEKTWKNELVKSTAIYAAIPKIYLKNLKEK